MAERLDPWGSDEIHDYGHLYKEFGIQKLEGDLELDHLYFRRGIAIAHRDFDTYVKALQENEDVYCMTGIASSGKFHIGHLSIINFVRFFEELGVDTYFAVADVDAYTSRDKIKSMEQAKENAVNNLAHVLALGVDADNVYVQSNMQSRYYELMFEASKKLTRNEFESIYGHIDPGKISAVFLQIADILYPQIERAEQRHGVVPIALEQDPHMRATRDVARRLPYDLTLPSSVYVKHVPGLKGPGTKMSSSDPYSALFLDDTPDEIEKKIKKHAFSGGQESVELHREKGGNPDVDVSFQLLRYFEPNDAKVEEVYTQYKNGELLTGELKQLTISLMREFFEEHHKKLKKTRKKAEKIVYG